MNTNNELFPHVNWVIAAFAILTLTLGVSAFFTPEALETDGAQAVDAALMDQTERADALHSDFVKPWWHLALERIIEFERI